MGFYPVTPGANQYVLGRPFVPAAVLHLPNGKQFRITAEALSPANRYVEHVLLDGKPLTKTFITQAQIMAGGELHFVMGASPNREWGSTQTSRPYSLSKDGLLP